MELNEILAKLEALRGNAVYWLKTYPGRYFDPKAVLDVFERFAPLREHLLTQYPSLVGDLPVRNVQPSDTSDFQGRGFVERGHLEMLVQDIDYCLTIMKATVMVSLPSMRVTREGVFFAGQYFDALRGLQGILAEAKQCIWVLDGYVDETVLDLLTSKSGSSVEARLLTTPSAVSAAFERAACAFNRQYGGLFLRTSSEFHDRLVVVDNIEYYHFGASLKDLGKRGFMFSRIEEAVVIDLLRRQMDAVWNAAKPISVV